MQCPLRCVQKSCCYAKAAEDVVFHSVSQLYIVGGTCSTGLPCVLLLASCHDSRVNPSAWNPQLAGSSSTVLPSELLRR